MPGGLRGARRTNPSAPPRPARGLGPHHHQVLRRDATVLRGERRRAGPGRAPVTVSLVIVKASWTSGTLSSVAVSASRGDLLLAGPRQAQVHPARPRRAGVDSAPAPRSANRSSGPPAGQPWSPPDAAGRLPRLARPVPGALRRVPAGRGPRSFADGSMLFALTRGSRTVVRLRLTRGTGMVPAPTIGLAASRAHAGGRDDERRRLVKTGVVRLQAKRLASTDPEATMIYAPPQLQTQAATIARPERADRAPASVPRAIRLAETAGSDFGGSASR